MIDETTAHKLAEMASWVDGGCSECARGVCLWLNEIFPEWHWEVPKECFENVPVGFGLKVIYRELP